MEQGTTLPLRCHCGRVQGSAQHVSPKNGNHVLCYCKDCQAFARFCGAEGVLDAHGGTTVYQLPRAWVNVTQGQDQLRCVRLTPKGLHRWYTACCRTPVGNMMGPGMPFLGLINSFIAESPQRAQALGPVRGYLYEESASNSFKPGSIPKAGMGLMLKVLGQILAWKLKGYEKPSAFFDPDGKPVSAPEILDTTG